MARLIFFYAALIVKFSYLRRSFLSILSVIETCEYYVSMYGFYWCGLCLIEKRTVCLFLCVWTIESSEVRKFYDINNLPVKNWAWFQVWRWFKMGLLWGNTCSCVTNVILFLGSLSGGVLQLMMPGVVCGVGHNDFLWHRSNIRNCCWNFSGYVYKTWEFVF